MHQALWFAHKEQKIPIFKNFTPSVPLSKMNISAEESIKNIWRSFQKNRQQVVKVIWH